MSWQILNDPEREGIQTRDTEPIEEPILSEAEEQEMMELWAADPGNQGG